MKKFKSILAIALLIILVGTFAYTINPTHFSMLFIGAKPSDRSHTLSAGQSEFDGTAYFDGDVTLGNATTDNTTITGILTLNSAIYGSSAFTTTGTSKAITVSGVTTSCKVIAIPYGSSINANDVLSGAATTNTVTVTRPASGTSGLTFFYVVVR